MKQHELLHVISQLEYISQHPADKTAVVDIAEEGGFGRYAVWACIAHSKRTGAVAECKEGHFHLTREGAALLEEWRQRGTCSRLKKDDCQLLVLHLREVGNENHATADR